MKKKKKKRKRINERKKEEFTETWRTDTPLPQTATTKTFIK